LLARGGYICDIILSDGPPSRKAHFYRFGVIKNGAPESAVSSWFSDSRHPVHHDRRDRSYRPAACFHSVCPVQGRHRGCHSSRHLRPALGLEVERVDDNRSRHRGSRRPHRSSVRRRSPDGHRSQGLAHSSVEAARSTGAANSSEAPSNNAVTSNKPTSPRNTRSARTGDSCRTRNRCHSHCYRPAACTSLIRNSLRNILRETTSSKR